MTPALQPAKIPNGYSELLEEIASRIARSQTRAALAVSRELVLLYWSIGAEILMRQKAEGWSAKVIDRLGRDLQARFPWGRGVQPAQLELHALPGGGAARSRNSATACGTFAVGSPAAAARQGEGTCSTRLVSGCGGPRGWNRDALGHT